MSNYETRQREILDGSPSSESLALTHPKLHHTLKTHIALANSTTRSTTSKLHPPRLKFCGFTREADLQVAIDCGVDAVGLNFYAKSPRCLSTEQAARLSDLALNKVLRVGVFVNEPPANIAKLVAQVPLDAIQLHGDEGVEYLQSLQTYDELRNIEIWRALSWRGNQFPEDEARCSEWISTQKVQTLLIDAHDPIQRGGTGKRARWDLMFPRPAAFGATHFLLAGGITDDNVMEAIEIAKPDGIDVASGIESSPGIKDPVKMQRIAEAALKLLGR